MSGVSCLALFKSLPIHFFFHFYIHAWSIKKCTECRHGQAIFVKFLHTHTHTDIFTCVAQSHLDSDQKSKIELPRKESRTIWNSFVHSHDNTHTHINNKKFLTLYFLFTSIIFIVVRIIGWETIGSDILRIWKSQEEFKFLSLNQLRKSIINCASFSSQLTLKNFWTDFTALSTHTDRVATFQFRTIIFHIFTLDSPDNPSLPLNLFIETRRSFKF